MKIKQLIQILEKLDPDLAVCVSHESHIEEIGNYEVRVIEGQYCPSNSPPKTKFSKPFVLLGDYGDYVNCDNYIELTGQTHG